MNLKVISLLPKTGLANRLFIWASGYTYAYLTRREHYVYGWHRVSIGPWIRNEKNKRLYYKYFSHRESPWYYLLTFLLPSRQKLYNPVIGEDIAVPDSAKLVIFDKLPDSRRYFKDIKPFRLLIRDSLTQSLHKKLQKKLEDLPAITVAIHIRRGDFNVNRLATPIEYFISAIVELKKHLNEKLEAYVFSDGTDMELSPVLEIEGVKKAPPHEDIIDLFFISKAQIIITSPKSTFSYWAGFLSKGAIIHHPDHVLYRIREEDPDLFEGTLDDFLHTHKLTDKNAAAINPAIQPDNP